MDCRILFAFILALLIGCNKEQPNSVEPRPVTQPRPVAVKYGEATPKRNQIRLLIIKHSRESMADGDADLAINAAKKAAGQGLDIKVIGNSFVDGRAVSYSIIESAATFSAYLEEQIKVDAKSGDTLILFTIGHGFQGGGLQNIGQRKDVMKVIADAAERNKQKIFWWQLSCHACSGLPSINSLSPVQQEYLGMYASSSAADTSAAYVQGKIMEKVFIAMAGESSTLDKNGDGRISAKELSSFLGTDRVFAKADDWAIFGKPWIPFFPVMDRNGTQGTYNEDYILMPN